MFKIIFTYGIDKNNFIFSTSRDELNQILLNEILELNKTKFTIPVLINKKTEKVIKNFILSNNKKKEYKWFEISNIFPKIFQNINISDETKCEILYNNFSVLKIHKEDFLPINSFKKIGVIVRQWDAFNFTNICISDLLNTKYPNLKIYLIDDSSIDDSFVKLSFLYPQIQLIRFVDRQEYTRCLNIGAEVAINDGCDFLFFTNSDTKNFFSKSKQDFFTNLVDEFKSNPFLGLISPKVMDWDGNEIQIRTSKKLGLTFDISTESYLTTSKIWKTTSGFDIKLIRYCEDLMLIEKIKKLGYFVKISDKSYFRHFGMGSSLKQVFIPTFYRTRNGIMILKNNVSLFNNKFYYFLFKWFKPHVLLIIKEFKSKMYLRSFSRLFVLFIGFIAGLFSSYRLNRSWISAKSVLNSRPIIVLKIDRFFEKRYKL